jgi:flagellar motor switch protein FliM
MTEAPEQTEATKEIYARILGRKGDETRLEPAIKATVKTLAADITAAFATAELDVGLTLGEHGEKKAGELFKDHSKGAVCALLGRGTSGPEAYLVFGYPVSGVVADIMLGSDPELSMPGPNRAPTALECDLIRQFANLVANGLQTTLSVNEPPEFLRIALKADEIRGAGSTDSVVSFNLSLGFGPKPQNVTLAVTHHLLLQAARLSQQTTINPEIAKQPPRNPSALTIKVPATGSIPLDLMTLGDVSKLRVGDVLPMPEAADNVRLKVKGRTLYECSLGRKGPHYAICLQRPHKALTDVLNGIGLPLPDAHDEEIDFE